MENQYFIEPVLPNRVDEVDTRHAEDFTSSSSSSSSSFSSRGGEQSQNIQSKPDQVEEIIKTKPTNEVGSEEKVDLKPGIRKKESKLE